MPDIAQQDMSYQPATKGYSFSTNPAAPGKKFQPGQRPKEKMSPFALLALEILGLVAVFVVFLLVLNFFNLISLSKIYPKSLGFLPHLGQTPNSRTATKATTFTSQTSPTANKTAVNKDSNIPYSPPFAGCPVDKTQCQNGQQVKKFNDQNLQFFYGLEYKTLNPNTNILAVIPGNLTTQNINQDGQNFLKISINNANMNTLAEYLIPSADFNYIASASSVVNNGVLGVFKSNSSTTSALLLDLQVISTKAYIPISIAKDGSSINNQNR